MFKQKESLSETNRIEAFSDGVFAIAITLLILEIKVPNEEQLKSGLLHALLEKWPNYLAFFIGFSFVSNNEANVFIEKSQFPKAGGQGIKNINSAWKNCIVRHKGYFSASAVCSAYNFYRKKRLASFIFLGKNFTISINGNFQM